MQVKDVAVTTDGSTVYFTDVANGRIMKHNVADNSVTAFCGGAGRCSGNACHSDPYTTRRNCATDRIFNFVQGLVLSPDNSVLYTSDSRSFLVYKITIATGMAEPLVGDNSRTHQANAGTSGSVVDGQGINGKIGESGLYGPSVSPDGSTIYWAEKYHNIIRKVTSAGNSPPSTPTLLAPTTLVPSLLTIK